MTSWSAGRKIALAGGLTAPLLQVNALANLRPIN